MKRQPRDKRRRGGRTVIKDRDRGTFAGIGRFRIARTSDVLAFAFPGVRRDTALVRLRKLYDAGLISVRSLGPTEENLYTLTRKGRRLIELPDEAHGRVPRAGLAHHLAVVAAWVSLARAVADRPSLRLDIVRPEWEIREKLGRTGSPLIPDALIQIRGQANDSRTLARLALEVDLGSEHMPTLAKKLRAYHDLRTSPSGLFGWRIFALLLHAPDASDRRISRITALLRTHCGSDWFIWRTSDDVEVVLNALEAPLADSHCSNGSREAAKS